LERYEWTWYFKQSWAEDTARAYVRKTQNDYGWDFSPAFITSGIYGNVLFKEFRTTLINDFYLKYTLTDNFDQLTADVYLDVEAVQEGDNSI